MEPIPPTLPFKVHAAYGTKPAARPVAPVAPASRAAGLAAGVVPGRVNFDTVELSGPGRGKDAAIPMYRNPAAKNAAATGVALGRTLDLQG